MIGLSAIHAIEGSLSMRKVYAKIAKVASISLKMQLDILDASSVQPENIVPIIMPWRNVTFANKVSTRTRKDKKNAKIVSQRNTKKAVYTLVVKSVLRDILALA